MRRSPSTASIRESLTRIVIGINHCPLQICTRGARTKRVDFVRFIAQRESTARHVSLSRHVVDAWSRNLHWRKLMTMQPRPPLPPFNRETALQKVRLAEDAWNSRDPEKV